MEAQNTNNSLQKSETKTRIFEISKSMALSFDRLNLPIDELVLENIVKDISSEYKNLTIEQMQKALRNGSFGHYGRTYRISTQEVSIWIRTYCKENIYKMPI